MATPSFYKQTDSRWAKHSWKTVTVGGSGCGPTCVANVVDALVKKVTPKEVFDWICKNGYMTIGQGTYWSGITAALKHYGIDKFEVSHDATAAKKALTKGHWLIGVVKKSRWTNGGHYILLYQITGAGKVYVSDPASYTDYRQKQGTWIEFANAQNCMWIDINPDDYKKSSGSKNTQGTTYTYWIADPDGGNVRDERNTKKPRVGVLKYGSKITVKNLKNKWWEIASGKWKGKFIHQVNLSKYEPHKASYKVLPSVGLRVRDGYTTNGTKVLTVIKKGTVVTSSKIRGNWIYVPAYKGWMCIKDSNGTYLKKVN